MDAVNVKVGVNVSDAVKVGEGVNVSDGVKVKVGVNVLDGVSVLVGVSVGVALENMELSRLNVPFFENVAPHIISKKIVPIHPSTGFVFLAFLDLNTIDFSSDK